ncbi:MAG: lipopolysaccharide assembly protein LapA domain-containing protein [Pseudomonadota bacterium]
MLRIIRLVFFLLVLILGLSFALLNAETVSLNYYFGYWQTPLALALVVALALGALLGVLASLGMVIGLKRENSRLRRTKPAETQTVHAQPLKSEE